MGSQLRRCFRCSGLKKLFKTGSAYSKTDTGGIEVTCPLCQGVGEIPSVKDIDRTIKDAPTEEKFKHKYTKKSVKKVPNDQKDNRQS